MNLTRLARYALDLFVELESETGQATGYLQTGGVWLAQQSARMQELQRIKAMGDRSGLATEILSAGEIAERLPFIHCDDLAGGLWVDQDGQVNPVDLCMAYARAARAQGVEIREHSRVVDIEARDGAVHAVELADGDRINCRQLVICAGAWSRQLAALAGVDLPIAACEHMYVVTETITGLPSPCPIIRDLDAGIYLKGDSGKLVLGAFETNPKRWLPGMQDAGFLMFDEDWEHAQPMLQAGIARAPLIGEQGITHFMNGPESFTPDTRQILGESPQCCNLFVAAGFNSIGIMSSAGVGKVMAEWLRDGEAPIDLWDVDIARFDPLQCSDAYLAKRIPEAVHNQFAMHWPFKQYSSARNLRRSVWHDALAQRGAVFGAPTGWERPLWYAADSAESGIEYSYGKQCWWPAASREARHCQTAVSLFELSPFAKFDVTGKDALAYLQGLCCSDVDIDVGRLRYSLMLNQRGGIEAEVTLTRLAGDHFRIVGGAATRFKDHHWMRRHLDVALAVCIEDVTENYAALGIMGPGSRAFLQELSGAGFSDAEFAPGRARSIRIGDCDLLAARFSYVGELGWELYLPVVQAPSVLNQLLESGVRHDLGLAGHFALDACRIEMGYRHWGQDMGPEDTPFEVGLDVVVDAGKGTDFIGRQALLEQQRDGCDKQLKLCEIIADDVLVLQDEPVYLNDVIVGHCTSGGLGFRTGKVLCFVMFYSRLAEQNACYQIQLAGDRFDIVILDKPPYPAELQ
jgi:4-methylaminobutanoate oxidase (formaldehyde-forming)